MKKYRIIYIALICLTAFVSVRCSKDYPIDEDGLLITTRTSASVGSFLLLGQDHQPVAVPNKTLIDTVAQTINIEVHFGTDLRNLFPQFSLDSDAKLEPKITGYVDFSDVASPRQWTVISGNRKVRKTYTVFVTVQQP